MDDKIHLYMQYVYNEVHVNVHIDVDKLENNARNSSL